MAFCEHDFEAFVSTYIENEVLRYSPSYRLSNPELSQDTRSELYDEIQREFHNLSAFQLTCLLGEYLTKKGDP